MSLLDATEQRIVAALAGVDARTLARVLLDQKTPRSSATLRAILAALVLRGHTKTAARLQKRTSAT